MIVRAKVVVTMDGPPIENGAVVVSGNRIVDVGKFPEISKRRSKDDVVDLGEQALLPGLINAHCHLDYTCLRGKIPRQKSFTNWIRAINSEKARLSLDDYVTSINEGFAEARRFGTTTIVNLTAFPELVSRIQAPIRTWWFAELIDVRDPGRANEIVDLAVEQLKSALECGDTSPLSKRGHVRALQKWGLAPHAPFTASTNLYRRCEAIAKRENILLTTHLAESEEEMMMSFDLGGPLAKFIDAISPYAPDPSLFAFNGQTPVRHMLESVCRLDGRWLIAHLNSILDSDVKLLAEQATKCHVVHCPRSHRYFEHEPFQFAQFSDGGFNVCLATDSLASNKDLSLFAEMRSFRKEFPSVAPEEILEMVTVNPARALRQETLLGRIRANFHADLIAVPIIGSASVFEEIFALEGPVSWSMIGGRILA